MVYLKIIISFSLCDFSGIFIHYNNLWYWLLGTTAEHVCLVGDSAGANLAVAIAMKASVSGIRQPDGILSVYGCLLMKYTPSPSRILALMDPLLSIGVLSLCLHGQYLVCSVFLVCWIMNDSGRVKWNIVKLYQFWPRKYFLSTATVAGEQ